MRKRFSGLIVLLLLWGLCAIPAQAAEGYLPMEEAAQVMRYHLENRETIFSVNLRTEETDPDEAFSDLFFLSMAHTGVPTQGDYIWWQVGEGTYSTEISVNQNERLYTYLLEMEYYSSAAQEAELNEKYSQVMASLELDGKSDIQKTRAIYDYIIENVVYDYEHLEDETYLLQYTAYAAMVQGTSVCQGYANLFYRMANDAGLDCRLVSGDGGGGPHSWNILLLGDAYYFLDATWDAGTTDYTYFLKGTENFPMHDMDYEYTVDPFYSEYPISTVDYSEVCEHIYTESVEMPTCTDSGYTLHTCPCGYSFADEETPPLGHTYEADHCIVCGIQGTDRGGCGENVIWKLEKDGTLIISGTGPMQDYEREGDCPAYYDPYEIKRIIVEEGVTHIGDYAFSSLHGLSSVTFPDSLQSIGSYAFAGSGIEYLSLPENVTHIGEAAFAECGSLLGLELPDSISVIGAFAFTDCSRLESVELPVGLVSMGAYAFSNCPALTRVTISCSDIQCGDGVFCWSGVETVIFEKGVTTIAPQLFAGCENLSSVTLPNTVITIGDGAFSQCYSLTNILLPNSVTTIGSYAFAHCDGLTSVMIPDSVTEIGEQAFYFCGNLSEIHFKGDAPEIASDSFAYVLATAYFPLGNETWVGQILQGIGGLTIWIPEKDACYHLTTQTQYAVDATCIHEGYSGDLMCTGCGMVIRLGETTPYAEHRYEDGWCLVCGEYDENWVLPRDITRLAGKHRYETAFWAADQMKISLGIEKFDTVVVASGAEFADALSGSYLAGVHNAPILLACDVEWVNDLTKAYIRENLNPGGTVYILGGTKAIPESFQSGLDGFKVTRLAGGNRLETNLMILEEAGIGEGDPILICTATDFADSLSASATKLPILLVYKDQLLDQQAVFMEKHKGGDMFIIGGAGAVSEAMELSLFDYGMVTRIEGGNRFETTVKIAEIFFDEPATVVLAYAGDFPDGLCGGALAAAMDAPLILTMEKYEQQAADYIWLNSIGTGVILGGEKLISETSVDILFDVR